MASPSTKAEILAALEGNAQAISAYYASLPEDALFTGDPDHWGPAHHLVHLTRSSSALHRALRGGADALPAHSTGRSRTYAQVLVAATTSVQETPGDKLLEMGRVVMVAPETTKTALIEEFVTASADMRTAAELWPEEQLDRHALPHSLMGELTVREMLLFFVLHERHHLKLVRSRLEAEAT
jgi:hypothetical protein